MALYFEKDRLGIGTQDMSGYAKSVDTVAKNQGETNKGKFLGIGEDGNVKPVEAPSVPTTTHTISYTSTSGDVKSITVYGA